MFAKFKSAVRSSLVFLCIPDILSFTVRDKRARWLLKNVIQIFRFSLKPFSTRKNFLGNLKISVCGIALTKRFSEKLIAGVQIRLTTG